MPLNETISKIGAGLGSIPLDIGGLILGIIVTLVFFGVLKLIATRKKKKMFVNLRKEIRDAYTLLIQAGNKVRELDQILLEVEQNAKRQKR